MAALEKLDMDIALAAFRYQGSLKHGVVSMML
jgi:hypothetical protein